MDDGNQRLEVGYLNAVLFEQANSLEGEGLTGFCFLFKAIGYRVQVDGMSPKAFLFSV
jgi:hypothetical protein